MSPPSQRNDRERTADGKVRPVAEGDRQQWELLWQGYLAFYSTALPADVTEATWARITGGEARMGGFVAVEGARLTGLLHYVTHPTTWTTQPACYLEDLYVAEDRRGTGIGHALIDRLAATGREQAWSGIHWITGHDNTAGMHLYDRLAQRTSWVRYEMDL